MIGYVLAAVALSLFGAACGVAFVVWLARHGDKDIDPPAADRPAGGVRGATRQHSRGSGTVQESGYRRDPQWYTDREWS